MRDAPEAVCIYIPLMKDLGMRWADIKKTPRTELEGLMSAYGTYNVLHAFDGYSSSDISDMAKTRPEVRSQYAQYMEANAKLKERLGQKTERPSVKALLG